MRLGVRAIRVVDVNNDVADIITNLSSDIEELFCRPTSMSSASAVTATIRSASPLMLMTTLKIRRTIIVVKNTPQVVVTKMTEL